MRFALRVGTLAIIFGCLVTVGTTWAAEIRFPETRRTNTTDTYHGVSVSDPYRWLESGNSPEVKGWLNRQNRLTDDYLEKTQQWREVANPIYSLYWRRIG